LLDN